MQTVPQRVLENARRIPDAPAFSTREGGRWVPSTWGAYGRAVERFARALVATGVHRGDVVAILARNRPDWVVADVAAMAVGALPAGIYPTNSAEEVAYVLDHSGARVVVVDDRRQWEKVARIRAELDQELVVVGMRGLAVDDPGFVPWEAFTARHDSAPAGSLSERLAALGPSDPATLIYTSGTTGAPKAVVLTHDNLAFTATSAVELYGIRTTDLTVSYLPLSHIAEQLFTIHVPAFVGFPVAFARSIERLRADLVEVRPTVFFGVPRVWENIERGIRRELRSLDARRTRLVGWAREVGRRVAARRNAGAELGRRLGAEYELAKRLVFDRLKARLGFDRLRLAITSAAPISPEVLEFLAEFDVVVHEVYGQSESTGPTTANVPGATRFGTVGRPWPGTEVVVADDGEILSRGRNVFAGYLHDAEATRSTLADGWLHSGDLGAFDEEGYLVVTGRKKEIIVTSGGKNVSPKAIETLLQRHPVIAEAMVVGDGRDYLAALVVPDPREAGGDLDAAIRRAVDEVNRRVAVPERIRRYRVLDRPFSVEAGELTPTLKLRRSVIAERYAAEIAELYPGPG
ncbi:MAG TPA: long-chain fatty acid--CoA ligase [Actinobacteria bacterium]|nr:long-chain fatty acid--CoA ligase [Actinomycetota bacterium]